MRWAAKRDGNERRLIRALELAGASVLQVSSPGAPDLCVGLMGRTALLEVKEPGERFTLPQALVDAYWEGSPIHRVETPVEALRAVGVRQADIETVMFMLAQEEEAAATRRSRRQRAPA